MRVLRRAVLRETLGLSGFYAAAYFALIIAGFATPMIKQGAPILSVLAFVPEQSLLLGLLALPLAMVTAFLGVIGRMREDGELTALMAAGVGTWRVAITMLPVAIALAVWLGISAHLILPGMSQRLMEGRSQLLQQALAAKVERRTPVIQEGGLILAAQAAEGDKLIGLFSVQVSDGDAMTAVYAPEARWVADPGTEDDPPALGLELHQARLLVREAGEDARVATAIVPNWSVRIPTPREATEQRADSMSTPDLLRKIRSASEETPSQIRELRGWERAFHIRLMLPVACVAFWAFGCGLALTIGRGNRMLAACIGVLTVVVTLFPAYVLARVIGERLPLDAGIWVWPPPLILGAIGAWLLWRHR